MAENPTKDRHWLPWPNPASAAFVLFSPTPDRLARAQLEARIASLQQRHDAARAQYDRLSKGSRFTRAALAPGTLSRLLGAIADHAAALDRAKSQSRKL